MQDVPAGWTEAAFEAVAWSPVVQSSPQPGSSPQPTFKSAKNKVNPDSGRNAARNQMFKLEKALEVLSAML